MNPDTFDVPPARAFPLAEIQATAGPLLGRPIEGSVSDEVDLRRTLARARFVANHWRVGVLSGDICGTKAFASHSLCMVLAALDGETDPVELGLLPEAHEAFKGL